MIDDLFQNQNISKISKISKFQRSQKQEDCGFKS